MKVISLVVATLCLHLVVAFPSSAQQRPVPVRDSETPLAVGDALIRPPPGADWYIVDRSGRGIIFLKKPQAPLHSFYAAAVLREFPLGAGAPADIFEIMKADAKRRSDGGGRFRELEFEFGAEEQRSGAKCARYAFKSEDHAARGAEGKVLLLIAVGYFCVHPLTPNGYLDVHYSERGGPQAVSAGLQKEGEVFLQGVTFLSGN